MYMFVCFDEEEKYCNAKVCYHISSACVSAHIFYVCSVYICVCLCVCVCVCVSLSVHL